MGTGSSDNSDTVIFLNEYHIISIVVCLRMPA